MMFGYWDGKGWNKDGFLDDVGPSKVPHSTYYGYTRCAEEVRPDIYKKVRKLVEDSGQKHCEDYMETALWYASENFAEGSYYRGLWQLEDSLLNALSDRARKKAEDDFRRVC